MANQNNPQFNQWLQHFLQYQYELARSHATYQNNIRPVFAAPAAAAPPAAAAAAAPPVAPPAAAPVAPPAAAAAAPPAAPAAAPSAPAADGAAAGAADAVEYGGLPRKEPGSRTLHRSFVNIDCRNDLVWDPVERLNNLLEKSTKHCNRQYMAVPRDWSNDPKVLAKSNLTLADRNRPREQFCAAKATVDRAEMVKWPHTLAFHCSQGGTLDAPRTMSIFPDKFDVRGRTCVLQSILLVSGLHFRACFPAPGEADGWITYYSMKMTGDYRFQYFRRARSAQADFHVDTLFYEVLDTSTKEPQDPKVGEYHNHIWCNGGNRQGDIPEEESVAESTQAEDDGFGEDYGDSDSDDSDENKKDEDSLLSDSSESSLGSLPMSAKEARLHKMSQEDGSPSEGWTEQPRDWLIGNKGEVVCALCKKKIKPGDWTATYTLPSKRQIHYHHTWRCLNKIPMIRRKAYLDWDFSNDRVERIKAILKQEIECTKKN